MPSDPFKPPGGLSHIKSTILWSILPDLVVFTAIATAVTVVSEYSHSLEVAPTMLTVLGLCLSITVSYRTSSASERFQEGRKLYAAVTLASRTFARIAWNHVPDYTVVPGPGEAPDEADIVKAMVEKKSMVNLCGAFCVALKHYLRGESGIFYKDLFPLVCYLPKYRLPSSISLHRTDLGEPYRIDSLHSGYSTTSSPQGSISLDKMSRLHEMDTTEVEALLPILSASRTGDTALAQEPQSIGMSPSPSLRTSPTLNKRHLTSTGSSPPQQRRIISPVPLLPSRNPPVVSALDYIPFWPLLHDIFTFCRGRARKTIRQARGQKRRRRPPIDLDGAKSGQNIPLEITLLLSAWVGALQRRKTIDVPTINALLAAIQSFSDSLTGLERIMLTPIPMGYSLHLRHVCWLYLALLPSQVHATLGWLTIPATVITSFFFLGFLAIGAEIELPFGYDDNDLDLDMFNAAILRELKEITSHTASESDPASFCFVDDNLPFASAPLYEGKSATQIVHDGTRPRDVEDLLRRPSGAQTELRRVDSLVAAAEKATGKKYTPSVGGSRTPKRPNSPRADEVPLPPV